MNAHAMTVRLLATTAGLAGAAAADITNPSFESLPDFAGWSVSGAAAISTASTVAPSNGARCALLTAGPIGPASLAAFLGCTPEQLSAAASTTTPLATGAAIVQTITVTDNDSLAFDFNFNNAEIANSTSWPDTAFVVINGVPHALASSATSPHGWTGVQRYTKGNLTAGTITIAFAVCNFADDAVSSQLMIDNISVVSNSTTSACGPADIAGQGAASGPDNRLDNNDFIVFVSDFFQRDSAADVGSTGGVAGADGRFDNNDFVAFVGAFFGRLADGGCDGR